MAASLLTLLDDVATILDDVAAMTKIATRKTAGVLGDDLALNAQQVSGVQPDRELPVVWAVAKGSFYNKLILVPVALIISAVAPWAITPLLMLGGLFLCYEGVEKLVHTFFHKASDQAEKAARKKANSDPAIDLVSVENEKIKGAIRTDFILSAEIIVISLGTVADASFTVRLAVLAAISMIMTVGVYGLVAGIVKLDDLGMHLSGRDSTSPTKSADGEGNARPKTGASASIGNAILWFAPWLMKTLSVVGTAAMFIVGGGIITHGFHALAGYIAATSDVVGRLPGVGDILAGLTTIALDSLIGVAAGAAVLGIVTLVQRMRGKGVAAH